MVRCLSKKNPLKYVQLNKYETAPNFIQLNQNLTLDCYLFVDLAELTCFLTVLAYCDHKIVLF